MRENVHPSAARTQAARFDDWPAVAIQRSHERSGAFGLRASLRPDYDVLPNAALALAREQNRVLCAHAMPVMETLYEQIVNTQSMIVLTNADGLILHSVGDDDFLRRAEKVALRPGANWAEDRQGTNAIGTALAERCAMVVHGDEHYLAANRFLTCSSVPILDPRGALTGVLDVTGDHRSYHQHTMALAKMSVQMIENHLFASAFGDMLQVSFHGRPEFLGTLMEGIAAFTGEGRFLSANRSAQFQLGLSLGALGAHTLSSLFQISSAQLLERGRESAAPYLMLNLCNGATVCARVQPGRAVLRPAWASCAPVPRAKAGPRDFLRDDSRVIDAREMRDAYEMSDAHGMRDAYEMPDVREMRDAHEMPDTREMRNAHEMPDARDVHEMPDACKIRDAHEMRDARGMRDVHEMLDTREMRNAYGMPDAHRVPNAHKMSDARKMRDVDDLHDVHHMPGLSRGIPPDRRAVHDTQHGAHDGVRQRAGSRANAAQSQPQSQPQPAPRHSQLDHLDTGDPQVAALIAKIRKVLGKDIALLITGETGTGKELLARAIHADSPRRAGPFVALNCASIPEALIESELFGYEEGAFTGARRKGAPGKLMQASGGTLFLDEIGDMPYALQTRLLRVLQERLVNPLGSSRALAVDIAIVCATHRNLRDMIAQNRFRKDLYYRLNGLSVHLPPLRERTDLTVVVRRILQREAYMSGASGASNVPHVSHASHTSHVPDMLDASHTSHVLGMLDASHSSHASDMLDTSHTSQASHASQQAPRARANQPPLRIAPDVMALFERCAWPGNFRQLGNLLRTAAAMIDDDGLIRREHLPDDFFDDLDNHPAQAAIAQTACADRAFAPALLRQNARLRDVAASVIAATLARHGGNVSATARALGVSRNTIYRKMAAGREGR